VTAATAAVEEAWQEEFGDRSWLAVSTLNVLDNTTLRFILEIGAHPEGPDLHFFFGAGTYDRQLNRLDAIDRVSTVNTPDAAAEPDQYTQGTPASTLINAVQGRDFTYPEDSLELVGAPERRREVEYVVQSIRDDLDDGINPSDIFVLARDVGLYQSIIEDVFETNEIPYHVETPRPNAHLPAYRFFKSLLDLLTMASNGEALSYEDLIDPLRLGFCMPDMQSSVWPLDDRIFLYLEQRLHDSQQRNDDEARPFEEWRDAIDDLGGLDFAWDLFDEYLSWVESHIDQPPTDGPALRGLMRSLLQAYIYQRIPDRRGIPEGPGVDSRRTNVTRTHPSSTGRQIHSQADAVGRHYDFARSILEVPASWEEISQAVGEVVGSGRYGSPNNDANAIRIVDIGNAYFHTASQAYFLGVAAGELPIEMEEMSFINSAFRNTVAREAKQGNEPLLHFDSRTSQYEVDLSLYEAALRASTGDITLLHRYKDSDRNQIAWSPFVDLLPTNEQSTQIRADQWLPEPATSDEWEEIGQDVCEKDRIRLLYHHAARKHPSRRPEIESEHISTIATYADAEAITNDVMPRYDRYARPPTELEITPDEPAFNQGRDLNTIVGAPVRPHELDLLGHCELKFYFYQLVFNHDGESVQRDELPFYSSSRPHYRLGSLPQVIRHHHPEQDYRQQWATIIEELLPDRQADLDAFQTLDELRAWFADQDFSEWHEQVLLPPLEDEWKLVQQELDAGIERDWHWQSQRDLPLDSAGDAVFRQPGHRRDKLPMDDGYELPVFFVRNSSYAEKASKQCWGYHGEHMDRACHSICQSCREVDDCSYSTKHVLDHRLHLVFSEDSNLVGAQYQERFDSGARRGYLKQNHHDQLRGGIDGGPEADFGEDLEEGWVWHNYWKSQLTNDLEAKAETLSITDDSETVSLSADEQFVRGGGCDSCVYKDMCMIPQAYGGDS
jgi:ATP-dependent helicase/nuclease subunit B